MKNERMREIWQLIDATLGLISTLFLVGALGFVLLYLTATTVVWR